METIKDVIMSLRRCRKGAVQTPEQLRFASFAVCSVGQLIAEDKVSKYVDDVLVSLKKVEKKTSKAKPLPEVPLPEPVAPVAPKRAAIVETKTPPSRRSNDDAFIQRETESKRRRKDMLR